MPRHESVSPEETPAVSDVASDSIKPPPRKDPQQEMPAVDAVAAAPAPRAPPPPARSGAPIGAGANAPTNPLSFDVVFSRATSMMMANAGPLLVLCMLGVGFDALLTYVGGALTLGYGEPVFAVMSTVLQEVLYFGPAVLLWQGVLRDSAAGGHGVPPSTGLDGPVFGTLLSGFREPRAWTIAMAVTGLYIVAFSLLFCVGLVLGGFLLVWVPGALVVAVKVIRSIAGPIYGLGYLATALAVARPNRSIGDSLTTGLKLMVSKPVLVGLVLSVGGFLEELAGLTVLLGILLDAFLLCHCAAVLRSMKEAGELTE